MEKLNKFFDINSTDKKPAEVKKHEDIYQAEINKLEKEQQRLQNHLNYLIKNENTTDFTLKERISDYEHANKRYLDCKERKFFN